MKPIETIFICNDGEYFLRHRRRVADVMAQEDHSVEVIAGGAPIERDRLGDWRYIHIRIERFSMNFLADLALAIASFREMAATRARSVQLITLKPVVISGLAALAARAFGRGPARIILTVPGLGRLMSPKSTERGFRTRASRFLVARTIRFITRWPGVFVTFETSNDRQHWVKYRLVRDDAAFVIGGAGVDQRLFHPPEQPRTGERLRVLFASRLLKTKGLDIFVDMARRLTGSNIEFVVAGMVEAHDPDGYAVKQLSSEAAITFLGEVTDMPDLLRGVDVVCLPTRYGEGIPRILIEAAATGLPCITTDLDGCCLVVQDGVNGVLVPISNLPEMTDRASDAVLKYRDDRGLLAKHGAASLTIFREGDFTEDRVVEKFIDLLLGGSRNC